MKHKIKAGMLRQISELVDERRRHGQLAVLSNDDLDYLLRVARVAAEVAEDLAGFAYFQRGGGKELVRALQHRPSAR